MARSAGPAETHSPGRSTTLRSFEVIAREGLGRPELVAEGISVALLTTAYGLLVAFVTQPFYNHFVTRLAEHANRIDVATHTLVDAIIRHRRLMSAER